MKVIIVLLVIGAIGLGAMYYLGGFSGFDPNKQGQEARAKITPGMTLKQVVDIAGKGPKYQAVNLIPTKMGSQTIMVEQVGTEVNFDQDKTAKRIKAGELPNGFVLLYRYSEALAFSVRFDGAGLVTGIEDAPTMGDLLKPPA